MTKKVMLVEDDPTMLSLLTTLLEMEGYQVLQIQDFETVVDELLTEQPDVILMDVHLKDLNGLEILLDIRANASLEDSKVIMSSGMDVRDQSMKNGANEFLLKPYMPDELIAKVKQFSGM